MKKSFYFSLLSFLIIGLLATTAGCKDEDGDSDTCMQSDWVGSYTGTVNCDGQTENVTLTITASGTDAIDIEYNTGTATTTLGPLTFNNCNIDLSTTDSGVTISVKATLDGDNLTVMESLSGGGIDSSCDITATRM